MSSKEIINEACIALKKGELVVIPTETVYGLAADASNISAIEKIYKIKNRPSSNPLIVHVHNRTKFDEWAYDIPEYVDRIVKEFSPGPISYILKKLPNVNMVVSAGQDTIALRIPNHPITLELLKSFDGGLAAPSANPYQRISPTKVAHVKKYFKDDVSLIIDGGDCDFGIESTILDCTGQFPVILREGSITADQIKECVGSCLMKDSKTNKIYHPGMDLKHYAPIKKTYLIEDAKFIVKANELIDYRKYPSAKDFTKNFYNHLHMLDEDSSVESIYILKPPSTPEWSAVTERIVRASILPYS